jgi:hypothetical protein
MESALLQTVVLTKPQKQLIENLKDYMRNTLKRTEPFICDHYAHRFLRNYQWDEKVCREIVKECFEFRDRNMKRLSEYKTRKGRSYKPFMIRDLRVRIKGFIMKRNMGRACFSMFKFANCCFDMNFYFVDWG